MKIVPIRIFFLLALLFPLADCVAAPNDPPPPTPPPPPGLPVDSGLVFLFTIAMVYGIYKIYQVRLKNKKASF